MGCLHSNNRINAGAVNCRTRKNGDDNNSDRQRYDSDSSSLNERSQLLAFPRSTAMDAHVGESHKITSEASRRVGAGGSSGSKAPTNYGTASVVTAAISPVLSSSASVEVPEVVVRSERRRTGSNN